MNHRDEILTKVGTVQSLPAAALEAVELMDDPETSISEIAKIIEMDPSLTANVLRLANSAYFGLSGSVGSVRDAIVWLGTKQVTHAIMTSAAASWMHQAIKGYDLSAGELWKHSVAVAITSEQFVSALDIESPCDMFTAALLHDVGKIVLGTFVDVDAKPIMKLAFDEQVPFHVAEQRVLGIDHAEVGAVLLDYWNLPAPIVNVSRWHHEPSHASSNIPAVDIAHMADMLMLMCGVGTGSDGLNYCTSRDVVSRLQVDVGVMEKVACHTLTSLSELHDMFATSPV
ncbi:MAG: HDOD domain-containing protein [Candidatus Hydrogenedentes bacterium]|nr:HDOD domain-containing protein [Candidatus Hydrogenedentota bacterium]